MNFGQALAALLNGRSITRTGWQRQRTLQAVQQPTGMITEPFIVERLSNGECSVYIPVLADIFATDWSNAGEGNMAREGATEGVQEHEPAGTTRR